MLPKVIEDCTTAISLNKYYTKAILRRAKAAEKQNDIDLALEDLATACIVESFQNNVTVSELDRLAKATGKTTSFQFNINPLETLLSTHLEKVLIIFGN